MANIRINGNSVVVTSALTLKDLQTIKKFRPDSLKLMGGKDNKDEIFRIALTDKSLGKMDVNGATFACEAPDGSGLATITMSIEKWGSDPKAQVAELFGVGAINLNKLEETLPAVLAEINGERQAVLDSISL